MSYLYFNFRLPTMLGPAITSSVLIATIKTILFLVMVKTLGAVTRVVVGTANLLGKGVKAVVGIAENEKSDSPVIEEGVEEGVEVEESRDMLVGKNIYF